MFACITERHECLQDKDELRESYNNIDNARLTTSGLYDVCEELLEMEMSNDSSLFKAVMNSIDLEELAADLSKWLLDAETGEDDESDSESQTEYDPAPVPKTYEQTKAEIVAKMDEMKRLVADKNDAYANIAKIIADLNKE